MPLQQSLLPLQDYHKAKRLAWNPQDIDLTTDASDWKKLAPDEQDVVKRLTSLFVTGEEGVASNLAPMLWRLGQSGDLREEEMFVTTQIFDEARHVEFFHRFFDEVVVEPVDFSAYYGDAYRQIFFDALPNSLNALLTDATTSAFARALIVYHVTIEGMLAETGYHAFFLACERRGVLNGLKEGVGLIKRDEGRHIAYGIYALQRLVRAEPALWEFVNDTLNEYFNLALGIIPETLAPYGEQVPFGISLDEMVTYAMDQWQKRYAAVERVLA